MCHVVGLAEPECSKKKSAHKEYLIILITVCSILFATTVGIVAFLLAYRRSKRRRRSRRQKLASLSNASGLLQPVFRLYTFSELENATQKFSETNLLGTGRGDGGTYKGSMPDGTLIAVKKLQRTPLQTEKEFVHDVSRIARLRQPNLVLVKGCCYNNHRGFIVYEFVANGSLDRWLHNMPPGREPLDWGERMRVATTLAQGLA